MKKLIVAVALICAATLSQAAAVDWSASKVVDPWTTASAGKLTPAKGWVGYMILNSSLDSVVADLKKGSTKALLAAAVGPTKTASSGAFNLSSASGSVASGEQTFNLIVLNNADPTKAGYYFVSANVTQTVDPSLDTVVGFGSQQTASTATSSWTSMSGGGGDVPEPTSALLLVLGVAGLALKRKQA